MSTYEPSEQEIKVTRRIGTLIAPFYAGYINRLGLKGSERVLDYGSGSGVCSKHLAHLLEKGGGALTCVDISSRWIEVARQTMRAYRCVEYRLGAVTEMDLPDGTFDVVFIHFVLHDIPECERAEIVNCLARKLVPGGKLFLREPLEKGGMTASEMSKVMLAAGLSARSSQIEKRWYVGEMYEGVFQKNG